MTRLSYRQQVANHFKARPRIWINGLEIAKFAGAYAWRSRISDVRRVDGLNIENRLRSNADGVVVSEYRYNPPAQTLLELMS